MDTIAAHLSVSACPCLCRVTARLTLVLTAPRTAILMLIIISLKAVAMKTWPTYQHGQSGHLLVTLLDGLAPIFII